MAPVHVLFNQTDNKGRGWTTDPRHDAHAPYNDAVFHWEAFRSPRRDASHESTDIYKTNGTPQMETITKEEKT